MCTYNLVCAFEINDLVPRFGSRLVRPGALRSLRSIRDSSSCHVEVAGFGSPYRRDPRFERRVSPLASFCAGIDAAPRQGRDSRADWVSDVWHADVVSLRELGQGLSCRRQGVRKTARVGGRWRRTHGAPHLHSRGARGRWTASDDGAPQRSAC